MSKGESIHIREVWDYNLEEEFALMREIVDQFNYIAMDTEFPGVVVRPVGAFKNINDYNYQNLKDNVDTLKLIQLGLTFSDEYGNLPTCGTDRFCIWQFNFREFNINEDIYASDSIELLQECGIDFQKNIQEGIDVNRFGELLMSSGIVLNDTVYWVTFHSGYDFGYLLKLLTCRSLPATQAGFFDLINMYFPIVYDIKHLMKFCNSFHGGLNKLAELLDVERIGVCHQAGSDSLLTACTFRKLRDTFFNGSTQKYAGIPIAIVSTAGMVAEFRGKPFGWLVLDSYLTTRNQDLSLARKNQSGRECKSLGDFTPYYSFFRNSLGGRVQNWEFEKLFDSSQTGPQRPYTASFYNMCITQPAYCTD